MPSAAVTAASKVGKSQPKSEKQPAKQQQPKLEKQAAPKVEKQARAESQPKVVGKAPKTAPADMPPKVEPKPVKVGSKEPSSEKDAPVVATVTERPTKNHKDAVPFEAPEPLGQVLAVLRKKTATVERRKYKLDRLRYAASNGKVLDEAQKLTLSKYDEVLSNIDLLQDLNKQFTVFAEEYVKTLKLKVNQEFVDRHLRELERVEKLLKIQDLLSCMGDENAREDFLKGQNGAVTLTEDSLKLLDQLYKLTTPLHVPEVEEIDGVKQTFDTQVATSAAHLVHLLSGRRRKVLGTTYKDIKTLVDSIQESGYFNRIAIQREVEVVVEEEPVQVVEAEPEPEVLQLVEEPVAPVVEEVEEPQVHLQEVLELTPPIMAETFDPESPECNPDVQDDSIFSTFTHNLPYTEVLAGAVSSFNFLQDSEIDLESPHMDPAVIAAHPMIPGSNHVFLPPQSAPDSVGPQFVTSQRPLVTTANEIQLQQNILSSPSHNVSQVPQPTQYVLAAGPAPGLAGADFGQIPTQTYTNQKFVTLPSFGNAAYNHHQQQQQPQQVPQSVTKTPSASVAVVIDADLASAQPKRHFMNVNAPDFQAINYGKQQQSTAVSAAGVVVGGANIVAPSVNVADQMDTRSDQLVSSGDNRDDAPIDLSSSSRGNYGQLSAQQQQYQSRGSSGGYGNPGNGNRGGSRGAPRGGGGSRGVPTSSTLNNGYGGGGGGGRGGRPSSGYSNGRGGSSQGYQSYRDGSERSGGGNNYFGHNSYQRGGDYGNGNNATAYTNGGSGNYSKRGGNGGGGGLRGDFQ